MNKAVQFLEDSLWGIGSGAITPAIVGSIKVPYYGQQTPIWSLASVGSGENRVVVEPYDEQLVSQIAKVLKDQGYNAYAFSKKAVCVTTSVYSGEQRELVKTQIKKLGEEAKVAVRGVRRQYRQKLDNELPKDERQKIEVDINNLTEQAVAKIDHIVWKKLEYLG